jgi:hypothetical protein
MGDGEKAVPLPHHRRRAGGGWGRRGRSWPTWRKPRRSGRVVRGEWRGCAWKKTDVVVGKKTLGEQRSRAVSLMRGSHIRVTLFDSLQTHVI